MGALGSSAQLFGLRPRLALAERRPLCLGRGEEEEGGEEVEEASRHFPINSRSPRARQLCIGQLAHNCRISAAERDLRASNQLEPRQPSRTEPSNTLC